MGLCVQLCSAASTMELRYSLGRVLNFGLPVFSYGPVVKPREGKEWQPPLPLTENMPRNHGLQPHRPSGFAGLQLTIAATAAVLHSCGGKGKLLFLFKKKSKK